MDQVSNVKRIRQDKRHLSAVILGILLILIPTILITRDFGQRFPTQTQYTYEVVNVYPHDPKAFTEGLVFDDGYLYEGTGLYAESTLRRVDLRTGSVVQQLTLPDDLFGEGITVFKDEIIQLTWLEHRCLVYDKSTFKMLREFSYPTEGWGLTCNSTHLIMSDGTAYLYFLNPETFQVVRRVEIRDDGNPVTRLNELEYIKGEVYANVWYDHRIARIDPLSGEVKGWIELSRLVDYAKLDPDNVLNGIAYNAQDDLIYVTGKSWPQLFEIRLIPTS